MSETDSSLEVSNESNEENTEGATSGTAVPLPTIVPYGVLGKQLQEGGITDDRAPVPDERTAFVDPAGSPPAPSPI